MAVFPYDLTGQKGSGRVKGKEARVEPLRWDKPAVPTQWGITINIAAPHLGTRQAFFQTRKTFASRDIRHKNDRLQGRRKRCELKRVRLHVRRLG